MTRTVICYVTNNTPYEYYADSPNLQHGKHTYGPEPITANMGQTEVCKFQKKTGSLYGTTGSQTYSLADKSTLTFYFNCPYTQNGNNGINNCWFYATLQPPSTGGPSAYVIACKSYLDGQAFMDTSSIFPSTGETITAYITISLIS